MPRLTTPDGFVFEFEDEDTMLRVAERLRGGAVMGHQADVQAAGADVRAPGMTELLKWLARTDGQRDLVKALARAEGMMAQDELAQLVGTDKYKMLGNLGQIYANAAERNITATDIVRRERYRTSTGRRAYRYGAGPLLEQASRAD